MKNYKVKVNPKQSKKIQKLLFKLGICWLSGQTKVRKTSKSYLLIEKLLLDKDVPLRTFLSWTYSKVAFDWEDLPEISAKKLIRKLEKKIAKRDKE